MTLELITIIVCFIVFAMLGYVMSSLTIGEFQAKQPLFCTFSLAFVSGVLLFFAAVLGTMAYARMALLFGW